MPIREESYDLFGSASGGVYSYDKAVSGSSITGNVLDLRSINPSIVAEYRVNVKATVTVAGATSITVKIQHSDSEDGTFKDVVIGSAVTDLSQGATLLEARLPRDCKRYIKAVATIAGTVTGGKIGGNVEPII